MPAEAIKTPAPQFNKATLTAALIKIDPSLTTETLASLIGAAGTNEIDAIKTLFGQINQLILGGSADVKEADLESIIKGIDSAAVTGKVISLAGSDSGKLVSLAGTDIGARYALIHGLPFAITGNPALYDPLNRDGSLSRFDPNTGERIFTDEWLKDRAQFLAVKFHAGADGSVGVTGNQSWVFEERTDGASSRVQVNADEGQRAAARMIFATDTTQTQTIVGSSSGDRVYAGAGDDNINTGAGDDYVEGGAGGDLIDGGRGNDTLLGGKGDDQLDGNLGDDKLQGGSGADYLVGGKGNDRLDGGDGFDTYVIDSGDGSDVIIDSDGAGEIVFDGQALTGTATFKDGKYTSADGKLTYAFAGDPEEGGVLVISSETGSVKLVNFKNGALGIKLGDGSSTALLTGSTDNTEVLDSWGRNRFTELPTEPRDPIAPTLPVDQPSYGNDHRTVAGISDFASYTSGDNASSPISQTVAVQSNDVNVKVRDKEISDFFSDPVGKIPLVTGAHIDLAIASSNSTAFDTTKPIQQVPHLFSASSFFNPADVNNSFGINVRQIDYALIDFHNAVSISSTLGSENLGDTSNIGVGTISIGTSFDKQPLSDDKYTDLGSKKIGLKG
jgi:RTX calcium-binding nonapeptide repeat (4 copies)